MSEKAPQLLLNKDGRPDDRANGTETEYSFEVRHPAYQESEEHAAAIAAIDDMEAVDHEELSVGSSAHRVQYAAYGISVRRFLRNGARRYIDNEHPEYSTRENRYYIRNAWDTILGHIAMAEFWGEAERIIFEKTGQRIGIRMMANNADVNGNVWSSHRNLQASRALTHARIIPALATHNIAMNVFSGGGSVLRGESKFGKFQYGLSERAPHFYQLANPETTRNRPIVNLRDEPEADRSKYWRIHDISKDTVFSPAAMAISYASTSLVLGSVELGLTYDDLMPEEPVRAIRGISADPTLKHTVKSANGSYYTGVELDLKTAERAMTAAELSGYVTPQDWYWGERWIELLDMLKTDPMQDSVRHIVQWVHKLGIIQDKIGDMRLRNPEHSDYNHAFKLGAYYSMIYPVEGFGMKAVREGWFEGSPDTIIFEEGLPMPDTRARLRGDAIGRLEDAGIEHDPHWKNISIIKYHKQSKLPDYYQMRMPEPLASKDPEFEETLVGYIRAAA